MKKHNVVIKVEGWERVTKPNLNLKARREVRQEAMLAEEKRNLTRQ